MGRPNGSKPGRGRYGGHVLLAFGDRESIPYRELVDAVAIAVPPAKAIRFRNNYNASERLRRLRNNGLPLRKMGARQTNIDDIRLFGARELVRSALKGFVQRGYITMERTRDPKKLVHRGPRWDDLVAGYAGEVIEIEGMRDAVDSGAFV